MTGISSTLRNLAISVLGSLSLAACASSGTLSTPMPEAEEATAPLGLMAFCQRHPERCARHASANQRIPLTDKRWAQLEAVNRAVNAEITPMTDLDRYNRREYWTMPISLSGGREGDCEDYALEKRQALSDLGWPADSLRLAVAHSAWTGPHAVLVVVTAEGDFVLDNLTDQVKPWRRTPYEWRKRQSGASSLAWRRIAATPVRASVGGTFTGAER